MCENKERVWKWNCHLMALFLTPRPQRHAPCCAVGTASIHAAAASATVAGRGLSAMCHPTSASTSTVVDTASALWAPASATLATRVTTVKKVQTSAHRDTYALTVVARICCGYISHTRTLWTLKSAGGASPAHSISIRKRYYIQRSSRLVMVTADGGN